MKAHHAFLRDFRLGLTRQAKREPIKAKVKVSQHEIIDFLCPTDCVLHNNCMIADFNVSVNRGKTKIHPWIFVLIAEKKATSCFLFCRR